MSEADLVAAGTRTIFDAREKSLVVGLTGRTGSGCSTVSALLQTPTFHSLDLPDQQNPPPDHEARKDRIVADWLGKNWHPFARISVSDVIAAFAFEEGDQFTAYAEKFLGTNPFVAHLDFLSRASESAKRNAELLRTEPRNDEQIRAAYDYYYRQLPADADALKKVVTREGGHTRLFQALGDNLRKCGRALPGEVRPTADCLFAIPARIVRLIDLGRAFNRASGVQQDYFVLDALRHQYEIIYFRQKLSRFYVMAVTTEEQYRRKRLSHQNFREDEINALDDKEYPDEERNKAPLKGYDRLVSQNIQACISASDVYVSNPGGQVTNPDTRELARSVCRYIALMQHPGLITPTRVERCMQAAWAARLNSGCISRQVGAVVTDAGFSIKAIGWNDAPQGQVPCGLRYSRDLLKKQVDYRVAFSSYELDNAAFRKELLKDKLVGSERDEVDGRHITYCFKTVYNKLIGEKNQVHTRALHGEENAFLQIAKHGGQGLAGGYLFTTSSPCELCAKKAFQLGMSAIYYVDPYPGISSDHVLGTQGTPKPPIRYLFSGAIGRAYHDLFEPMMPYKDELNILRITPTPPHQRQEALGLRPPTSE